MSQGGDHPGGGPGSGSTLPAVGGPPPRSGGAPSGQVDAPATGGEGGDRMIGQVIDNRYRIIDKLGEGGMGEVYAAEHVHIEKRVAIKLLRSEIITNEQAVIRFRREAKETSSIGHRNIIAIEDFGTLPDGRIYLAMELLDGKPLNEMLYDAATGTPLDAGRLLNIIIQTGHGLAAAHQKGIVHRDMKPENIFITTAPDGQDVPKILDFGIAKVSGADGNNHLTQTGTIFGTPYYMAPEQALGQAVDQRADIYAVGVIMYECFTGTLPFTGESFMGILTQHITAEPPPPAQAAQSQGRELHPAIENIIVRAMKKDAGERYQSMDELVEALVAVYRQLAGPGMSSFLAAHPPPGSEPMAAVAAPTPQPFGAPPSREHTPPPYALTPQPHTPAPELAGGGERRKGKGGLIAAIVALLVLGGGGAGAFALFGGFGGDDAAAEASEHEGDEDGDERSAAEADEPAEDSSDESEGLVAGDEDAGAVAEVDEVADAAPEAAEPVQVLVNSRPQGAAILHDGERIGRTPTLVKVSPDDPLVITIRRRGRQPETLVLDGSEPRVDVTLASIGNRGGSSGRGDRGGQGGQQSGGDGDRGGDSSGGKSDNNSKNGGDRDRNFDPDDPASLLE